LIAHLQGRRFVYASQLFEIANTSVLD
jgi:hypothetical protein